VIEPEVADQVTVVLVKPVTVAVNCCVPPVCIEAEVGVSVIEAGAAAFVDTPAAEVTPPQPLFTITIAKTKNIGSNVVHDERCISAPLPIAHLQHKGAECFYVDSRGRCK
jgi:hypothetical protein